MAAHKKNENLTFEEHFNLKVRPKLSGIAKEQRKIHLLLLTNLLLIISVWLILKFIKFLQYGDILLVIITCVFFFFFIWCHCDTEEYKGKCKKKHYNALFSYLGNFKRYAHSPHGKQYWRNISMIKQVFGSEPKVDDYIKGSYKKMLVEIEDLRLISGSGKNSSTIFEGLILTIPQLKTTKSTIIVRDKKFTDTQNKGQEVRLEDVKFNKIFKVSTDDQIEARYILTPTLMEYLKTLHNKGIIVTLCFQDEEIYIAIKTKKNMFEPPLFRSALSIKPYQEIIEQLESVLKIIDILKLDKKAIL